MTSSSGGWGRGKVGELDLMLTSVVTVCMPVKGADGDIIAHWNIHTGEYGSYRDSHVKFGIDKKNNDSQFRILTHYGLSTPSGSMLTYP